MKNKNKKGSSSRPGISSKLPQKAFTIGTGLSAAMEVFDQSMAETVGPRYIIEIFLTKSPKKGVKCGAVVLIQDREVKEIEWDLTRNPLETQQMQQEMNSQTQVLVKKILFKETDNRWIPFAIKTFWEIFDEVGGDANMAIKSPKLEIQVKKPRSTIIQHRYGDQRELFKECFMIDTLLGKGYTYDVNTKEINKSDGKVRKRK